MNGVSPSTPESNTVTSRGWLSRAACRASRSNRARKPASAAYCGLSTLTATSRPSTSSLARHTVAMPPVPSTSPQHVPAAKNPGAGHRHDSAPGHLAARSAPDSARDRELPGHGTATSSVLPSAATTAAATSVIARNIQKPPGRGSVFRRGRDPGQPLHYSTIRQRLALTLTLARPVMPTPPPLIIATPALRERHRNLANRTPVPGSRNCTRSRCRPVGMPGGRRRDLAMTVTETRCAGPLWSRRFERASTGWPGRYCSPDAARSDPLWVSCLSWPYPLCGHSRGYANYLAENKDVRLSG